MHKLYSDLVNRDYWKILVPLLSTSLAFLGCDSYNQTNLKTRSPKPQNTLLVELGYNLANGISSVSESPDKTTIDDFADGVAPVISSIVSQIPSSTDHILLAYVPPIEEKLMSDAKNKELMELLYSHLSVSRIALDASGNVVLNPFEFIGKPYFQPDVFGLPELSIIEEAYLESKIPFVAALYETYLNGKSYVDNFEFDFLFVEKLQEKTEKLGIAAPVLSNPFSSILPESELDVKFKNRKNFRFEVKVPLPYSVHKSR